MRVGGVRQLKVSDGSHRLRVRGVGDLWKV